MKASIVVLFFFFFTVGVAAAAVGVNADDERKEEEPLYEELDDEDEEEVEYASYDEPKIIKERLRWIRKEQEELRKKKEKSEVTDDENSNLEQTVGACSCVRGRSSTNVIETRQALEKRRGELKQEQKLFKILAGQVAGPQVAGPQVAGPQGAGQGAEQLTEDQQHILRSVSLKTHADYQKVQLEIRKVENWEDSWIASLIHFLRNCSCCCARLDQWTGYRLADLKKREYSLSKHFSYYNSLLPEDMRVGEKPKPEAEPEMTMEQLRELVTKKDEEIAMTKKHANEQIATLKANTLKQKAQLDKYMELEKQGQKPQKPQKPMRTPQLTRAPGPEQQEKLREQWPGLKEQRRKEWLAQGTAPLVTSTHMKANLSEGRETKNGVWIAAGLSGVFALAVAAIALIVGKLEKQKKTGQKGEPLMNSNLADGGNDY